MPRLIYRLRGHRQLLTFIQKAKLKVLPQPRQNFINLLRTKTRIFLRQPRRDTLGKNILLNQKKALWLEMALQVINQSNHHDAQNEIYDFHFPIHGERCLLHLGELGLLCFYRVLRSLQNLLWLEAVGLDHWQISEVNRAGALLE